MNAFSLAVPIEWPRKWPIFAAPGVLASRKKERWKNLGVDFAFVLYGICFCKILPLAISVLSSDIKLVLDINGLSVFRHTYSFRCKRLRGFAATAILISFYFYFLQSIRTDDLDIQTPVHS